MATASASARQHAIGPYVADFYCPAAKLVIEIDGMTHEHSQERDHARNAHFARLGLTVVRFRAAFVLADPDRAANAILDSCRATAGPSTTQPVG